MNKGSSEEAPDIEEAERPLAERLHGTSRSGAAPQAGFRSDMHPLVDRFKASQADTLMYQHLLSACEGLNRHKFGGIRGTENHLRT